MYVHPDARGHVWVENSCVVPSLYVGAGDKIRYSGAHGHVLVENSCMTSLYVGAGDQIRYLRLHDKHSTWVVKSRTPPLTVSV